MKGELLVLYPSKPPERRQYLGPVPTDILSELVGGSLAVIPLFDHIITFDGVPSKAQAFCNSEAYMLDLQDNFWANAIWHYILRSKGEQRLMSLKGPVVIVTGDEDFMEQL